MKYMLKSLTMKYFIALMVFVSIFADTGAQNLVQNGSFENWTNDLPTNWIGAKTNIDTIDNVLKSDQAIEGNFSVQLINTSSSDKRFTCDPLQVNEGESYVVTYSIKGNGTIRVGIFDTDWGKRNVEITATADWKQHTQIVTAKNSSTTGEFIFYLKNTNDTDIFLDDVTVVQYFGADILGFYLVEEIRPAIISSSQAQVSSTIHWMSDYTTLEPIITLYPGAQVTPTILPVVFDGIKPVKYKVTSAEGTTKIWSIFVKKTKAPVDTDIATIQFTENETGNSSLKGELVNASGIITAINSGGFFMQDGVGAWNGIWVNDTEYIIDLLPGDSVTIIGLVEEINNLTQIVDLYELTLNSSGNDMPLAETISITDINESFESVLVNIKTVSCIAEPDIKEEWKITDINKDTLIVGSSLYAFTPELGQEYNSVTGCISYAEESWRILPRNTNDISVTIDNTIDQISKESIKMFPNPVNNNLYIENLQGINKITIANILGQTVYVSPLITSQITINTSELNKGIYIVTFTSQDGLTHSEKIIKK
jgi:hypothetical protein